MALTQYNSDIKS